MEVFLGTRLHSVWRTEFQKYLEYFILDCYVSALEEWLEKKLNMVKWKFSTSWIDLVQQYWKTQRFSVSFPLYCRFSHPLCCTVAKLMFYIGTHSTLRKTILLWNVNCILYYRHEISHDSCIYGLESKDISFQSRKQFLGLFILVQGFRPFASKNWRCWIFYSSCKGKKLSVYTTLAAQLGRWN